MTLYFLECSLNQIIIGDSRELMGFTIQQPLLELEGRG
jgi:hypothetical protein